MSSLVYNTYRGVSLLVEPALYGVLPMDSWTPLLTVDGYTRPYSTALGVPLCELLWGWNWPQTLSWPLRHISRHFCLWKKTWNRSIQTERHNTMSQTETPPFPLKPWATNLSTVVHRHAQPLTACLVQAGNPLNFWKWARKGPRQLPRQRHALFTDRHKRMGVITGPQQELTRALKQRQLVSASGHAIEYGILEFVHEDPKLRM